MKLQRLTKAGHALVDEQFLSDGTARLNPGPGQVEEIETDIELDELRPLIHDALQRFAPGDLRLDAYLGVRLHQHLRLTRRIARDRGAWRYLAAVAFPEYVRHRFTREQGGQWNRTRFLGIIQQNAFARIWWIAELTRDDADYSLPEQVLASSAYDPIFDRAFSWHPPMVRAFVKVMNRLGTNLIETAVQEVNHALSTVAVELLDEAEAERLVKDVIIKRGGPTT